MSSASTPPGDLSFKEFELFSVEIGEWIWETAQDRFYEKHILSQLIAHASIDMIPVFGDTNAARNLVAISAGFINNQKKLNPLPDWAMLGISMFALIPALDSVIQNFGRIARPDTDQPAIDMADELPRVLCRLNRQNKPFWFETLDVLSYQDEIIRRFDTFCDMVILSVHCYGLRFSASLPQSIITRTKQWLNAFKQIKTLAGEMIPKALKELHAKLVYLYEQISSGQLIDPYAGKTPVSADRTVTTNPGYDRPVTEEHINAILDKYIPPGSSSSASYIPKEKNK